MSLVVARPESLQGQAGVNALQQLKEDMTLALACENYTRLRQLDHTCMILIDKVCHENRHNKILIRETLLDIKSTYATLIDACAKAAKVNVN
ncbi:hypothetical protein [Gilvimarinus chinensis]|uniref:hypothetical protein n=1 Tax=Gilvimarinus chinensis TaxID=396005 RepID=UPI0003773637|nr:hypothetical protein [Gilvimarinus chinensis]